MRYYDVFNGDADGICALHQLRLADPLDAVPITGLKRDIALLARVPAQAGDVVTVLDISLERNRSALLGLLGRGAVVHYFDHHHAGDIPSHPHLETIIDASGSLCTSALVDRHLGGRFRIWAIVGAFGDGLDKLAHELADAAGFDAEQRAALRELGAALNYNAYGETPADVLVAPIELYRMVAAYSDPFELMRVEPMIGRLAQMRRLDLERARELSPVRSTSAAEAYVLPDEAWSRRVRGSFANRLAVNEPDRAHAVLTPLRDGGYVVSVRSPAGNNACALDFCRSFPTGGGRIAAAGIDRLAEADVESFLDRFMAAFKAAAHV